jgi:hypothetical protein
LQESAFAVGVLAVVALGLSAGALLAEAGVLVPFWRSENPESFLAWYKRHAGLLLRFFGPLEVASGLLVIAATILAWSGLLPGRALFTASTGLTVAVLASFPLYFKSANARFAAGSVPNAKVEAELKRWATWHWARTTLAIVAFLSAASALARTSAPAA